MKKCLKRLPLWGLRSAFFCSMFWGVVACSPELRNHGYTPSDAEIASIVVGVDGRASVEDAVGVPAFMGVGEENKLYYVSSRWRHFLWQAPEPVERQVLVISLDQDDIVTNVERFTLQDGQVIALSRQVTQEPVQDGAFLRQLLGAIGNFDPAQIFGEEPQP